jgi:hypothetical protein
MAEIGGVLATQLINAIQSNSDKDIVIRTGTTVSGTSLHGGTVAVALDNDPSGTPVTAISVAGALQLGVRVACLAYPPRGLLVLGQIGGAPSLQTLQSQDFSNQSLQSTVTAVTGSPIVGFSFTAPASGSILLEVSTLMDVSGMNTTSNVGPKARVFAQVRTGSTVGSGTLVWNGDTGSGPLILFEGQKPTGTVTSAGLSSGQAQVTGLTPNQTYNASYWYRLDALNGGAGPVFSMFLTSRRLTGLLLT